MGQKIAFATTNWKDKPNKPVNMTQAEWDARESSKFNGFPFPIREKAIDGSDFEPWNGSFYGNSRSNSTSEFIYVYGPGTDHPIGFTLEELVEIFWRVKRYNINLNVSQTIVSDPWLSPPEGPITDTLYTSISGKTGTGLSRGVYEDEDLDRLYGKTEESLITQMGHHLGMSIYPRQGQESSGSGYYYYPEVIEYYPDGFPSGFSITTQLDQESVLDGAGMTFNFSSSTGSNGAGFYFDFSIYPYVIKPAGQSLYYPLISFVCAYQYGPNIAEYRLSSTRGISFDGLVSPVAGSISFLGKNLPIYSSAGGYPDTYFPSTSLNGSIGSPNKYWEYDDGNGNPIYDKDTGEILRDPVTGIPV